MELLNHIKEKYEQKYERTFNFKTRMLNAKTRLHEIKDFLESENMLISLDYSETRKRGAYFLGSYNNASEHYITIKGTINFICTNRMYEYTLKKFPELKQWRRDEIIRHDGRSLEGLESRYFISDNNAGFRIHDNGNIEINTSETLPPPGYPFGLSEWQEELRIRGN